MFRFYGGGYGKWYFLLWPEAIVYYHSVRRNGGKSSSDGSPLRLQPPNNGTFLIELTTHNYCNRLASDLWQQRSPTFVSSESVSAGDLNAKRPFVGLQFCLQQIGDQNKSDAQEASLLYCRESSTQGSFQDQEKVRQFSPRTFQRRLFTRKAAAVMASCVHVWGSVNTSQTNNNHLSSFLRRGWQLISMHGFHHWWSSRFTAIPSKLIYIH